MRLRTVFMLMISLVLCFSAMALEKLDDGVILSVKEVGPNSPKRIKVQVVAENIFHIQAAPSDNFSERPSLVVEKTDWPAVP